MLSKFRFFGAEKSIAPLPEWRAGLERAVREAFGSAAEIIFVPGGTLGVCAYLRIGARRRFLKTHLPDDMCRLNLVKEAGLLVGLYGDLMQVEQAPLRVSGEDHLCLIMDELDPLASPLSPDAAGALIDDCVRRLAAYPVAGMGRFSDLLVAGEVALNELTEAKQVGDTLRDDIAARLALLRRDAARLVPSICHGDYGPRNIMAKKGMPVIIDWEDAFEGVAGYDFFYWLSFLENRKYYPVAFGRTTYGRAAELAMLTLIVVLKSALSVRSGAFAAHRVPIEARLREIVEL